METKQLRRIKSKSIIGGVAAGVAEYFGVDTALVRFIFMVLLIFGGGFPMFLLYIILWAALPKAESMIYDAVPSVADMAPVPFQNRKGIEVLGYVLLGIGGLLLFDKIFYWIHFQKFIPSMILIGVGSYLIFRHSQNQNASTTTESTNTYGPMTYEEKTNQEN
jgi:phage shock protein C